MLLYFLFLVSFKEQEDYNTIFKTGKDLTLDILTHSVEILNFFLHFNILISHLSRCLSRIIPYHDISDLLHGMKKTGALMLQRRKVKLLKKTCTQKKPQILLFSPNN